MSHTFKKGGIIVREGECSGNMSEGNMSRGNIRIPLYRHSLEGVTIPSRFVGLYISL